MIQIINVTLHDRQFKDKDGNTIIKDKIINSSKGKIRPYIALRMNIQAMLPVSAVLSIGNPTNEFSRNLFMQKVTIEAGYNIKNGVSKVFVGQVAEQPYYTDGGVTDQILHIPLILYSQIGADTKGMTIEITPSDTIEQALKKFNTNLIFADESIKSENVKSVRRYATFGDYFSQLQTDFISQEEVMITVRPSSTAWVITRYSDFVSNMGTTNTNNTTTIPNTKSYTSLKSKYAVIGLDGCFTFDLAYFIPQLVGSEFIKIPNLGTNFNIFQVNSMNKNSSTTDNNTFRILEQNIYFDTFGGNSHNLRVFLNSPNVNLYAKAKQQADLTGGDVQQILERLQQESNSGNG